MFDNELINKSETEKNNIIEKINKNKNKLAFAIILIIAFICLIIIVFKLNKPQKNDSIIFDVDYLTKGTAPVRAVMDENTVMMLTYLDTKGASQTGIFKIKNKSNKKLKISKDNFTISYRTTTDTEEGKYFIKSQEELLEYMDISIEEPDKGITLKKGESAKIKVKATLKKNHEQDIVVGSINVEIAK